MRPAPERVAAVAAIALDTLDLTALEPGAQSTCLETMARLLCSVDVPLQLLVRRRRFAAPGPPSGAAPSPIAADQIGRASCRERV